MTSAIRRIFEESPMPKKATAVAAPKAGRRAKRTAPAPAPAAPSAWPPGFGALAKAQQEGAKVFETLIRQGQRFEQKTREAAADTAARARDLQQLAGGTWDKLEQVFEDRVARALAKLGIHTQSDVQRLTERVDELSEAVHRLLAERRVVAKTPARKKTTRARKRA
jgi:poly(hydroxyalkanoate) granule-associated protein